MTRLKDAVVSIHYTLRDENGEVIDSSQGSTPLEFLYGRGVLIKGLEDALADKSEGDTFNVKIPPEDAYGIEIMDQIQTVPLAKFNEKESIFVGAELQLHDGTIARVTNIADEMVSLDFNHPLAGKTLDFDVSVEHIRKATAKELEEGRIQVSKEGSCCSDPDCSN